MDAGKMSIVVLSDKREQLQMAAMLASVGAVSGSDVMVFLSMNALRHFVKGSSAKPSCEGPMGELMETKKVPPFLDLFGNAVELGGAKVHPCSMAMDVLGLEGKDLVGYVGEPMGLTQFLDVAAGSQVWSF